MFAISFKLPFSEAIRAANRRGAMLPKEYYALPAEYRQFAFTATGLAGLDQIEQVQKSLQEALEAGKTFSEWKQDIPLAALSLQPARLELIFRTHAQTGYMAGHWRAMTANAERRPFWMYSAINDARTRPSHRAMSGYIARWDDPVWQRWFPPAGFNCRCTVISLTADQARVRGYPMQDRAAEPDKGFAGVPAGETEKLARQMRERLYTLGSPFTQAFERALEAMLRPTWLTRTQLGMARVGLGAAARENPQLLALTPAEFYAIRRYSGKDYLPINRRLRSDTDATRFTARQLGTIQSLTSAIRKLEVPIDRLVHRGIRVNGPDFERLAAGLNPGAVVVNSGFLSTSLDRGWAEAFSSPTSARGYRVMFEIETTRGIRINNISMVSHELEILFAPGMLFEVVAVQRTGKVMLVRLRDGRGRPKMDLST